MLSARCLSSYSMTKLLNFRNPEEHTNRWVHISKVICTEISLAFLVLLSTVETVCFIYISLLNILFFLSKSEMFELLQSSSFTMIWALCTMVSNLILPRVIIHESFAREWANNFTPTFVGIFRDTDKFDVNLIREIEELRREIREIRREIAGERALQEHLIRRAIAGDRALEEHLRRVLGEFQDQPINPLIDLGAKFILEEVLDSAEADTKELFIEMDPAIFPFIATKAVYIYGFGSKKNDLLPDFFKAETKALISILRKNLLNQAQEKELARLIADPKAFSSETQEVSTKDIFNKLREAGSTEIFQGGLFIIHCFKKAQKNLSAQEETA